LNYAKGWLESYVEGWFKSSDSNQLGGSVDPNYVRDSNHPVVIGF